MDGTHTRTDRYSRGAIAFHWAIALLIIANFILAWTAEDLPKAEAMVRMGTHKAVGITVLLLSIGRILWRLTHRPPPLRSSLAPWERALAKVTHTAFYLLMIAIPVAGWGLHSAASGGKPVSIFGLFGFPSLPVSADKATAGLFGELHEVMAIAMLVLLALHVAGALKHQFLDKDGTLGRMLPGA